MNKITTDTWIQQFTLFLNGNYVRWQDLTLNLVEGSTNVLVFDHQDSYLSGDPESSVRLQFAPGMDVQGVNCDPPLGQLTPLVKEEKSIKYTFTLDKSTAAGIFAFQFDMPEYVGMPKSQLLPGQVIDVPWLREFTIRVDGEKKDWSDAHLAVVGRGGCKLTLDYAGSPLIGLKDAVVALESEFGGGVPNLVANPKFGDLIPMVSGKSSMDWDIQSTLDAGDALFNVKLVMPKFLGMPPSPLLPGHILNNVWGDIALRINDVSVSLPGAWFYIADGETVTVTLDFSASALPVVPGVAISLDLKPGGVGGGVSAKPEFEQPVPLAGHTTLTWEFSLKPDAVNGAFVFEINIHGAPGLSASPVSGSIFKNVWSEFEYKVDGEPVSFEELFVPVVDGNSTTLTVNCEKSTLRGLPGAKMALQLLPGEGGEGLIVEPQKGAQIPIEADTKSLAWEFLIKSGARSLPFRMQFLLPDWSRVPTSQHINGYIYHDVWEQEFTLYINEVKSSWSDVNLELVAGATVILRLDFTESWLVGLLESFICLECEPEKEELNFISDPAFEQKISMNDGVTSLTWTISTVEARSGSFKFFFRLPEHRGLPNSPDIYGSVFNFAQEVDVTLDLVPVLFKSNEIAYPCRGAEHRIIMTPSPQSLLLNKRITMEWIGAPPTDLGLWMSPRDIVLLAGENIIRLNCVNAIGNATFNLRLLDVESGRRSFSLTCSLGHNSVGAFAWTEKVSEFGRVDYCEVFSQFLRTPVPEVTVEVLEDDKFDKTVVTDAYGKCKIEYRSDSPWNKYSFRIVNAYDGSIVHVRAP